MEKSLALGFGKNLKYHRKKAGYTQEKLAELTEVSLQHIQRLEGKNPSGVTLETIQKFAKVFNLSAGNFLADI